MTHGRKPRKPRQVRGDTLAIALRRATRLTGAEVHNTMEPLRTCERRLREGVATEDQHTVICTGLLVAAGIEDTGVVRGLREHLASGQAALASVRTRALASGAWRPTALYYFELDAIREALDLHEFQLRQVSSRELHDVAQKLIAQTLSAGGAAVRSTSTDLGLQAA